MLYTEGKGGVYMNISAVEIRTGLTRANIRYYESEGLLHPDRLPNGYRDYTDSHVETLKKIKLLRQLRVPLEEIKAVQQGEAGLADTLDIQADRLTSETQQLENARRICREIQADGATYDALDAQKYLDALSGLGRAPSTAWAKQDTLPIDAHPWRRYLARGLDELLYSLLFAALYYAALHRYPTGARGQALLAFLFTAAANLALEPVFLHLWGATPGKWIFGIHVLELDGSRLTYGAALRRTWWVIRYGQGFYLPVYGLWRNWRSYQACREDGIPWDEELSCTCRDTQPWRAAAFLGVCTAAVGLIVLCLLYAQLPLRRGDLTVAEFAENYNFYLHALVDPNYARSLDANGQWGDAPPDQLTLVFGQTDSLEPAFEYELEDGVLTGVSYTVEYEGSDWLNYDTALLLTTLAYAGAQREVTVWNNGLSRLAKTVEEHRNASFSETLSGVRMQWMMETENYIDAGGFLVPEDESRAGRYRVQLRLERVP